MKPPAHFNCGCDDTKAINALPIEIKNIEQDKKFVKAIKYMVLHYQFYDL